MREIVYFSGKARTSGNFDTSRLMEAGRMDVAIHTIIASFFLSHDFRKDVKLHLVFYGMPDPPKHLELQVTDELEISKKDVANLIKKMLYKCKKDVKTEVFPKCFIEKKSFLHVIEELHEEGKNIFILDENGEDIRELENKEMKNAVFVLGDHEGFPQKELKRLKTISKKVSVGPKIYFASQVAVLVNNELDRRGL